MPGRLLSTLARVAPSPLPKLDSPAKNHTTAPLFPPVYSYEAPEVKGTSKSQESLVMDIFKRHDKHNADKKSPKGKLRILYECAPMALIFENGTSIEF